MPQLVKGGKWVFGWVVVGSGGEIAIPSQAWREYGFQVGEEALFMPGSRRSGGFSLSTARLMAGSALQAGLEGRLLGRGAISQVGRVRVPPGVGVRPGDRLLAVRGSGYGLGFVARGPIYQEALSQSHRLEQFE
jgi:hypothetical protein